PADREPRQARVAGRVVDVLQPGGGPSSLRRRLVDGTDAGVVGRGGVELRRRVGRLSDRHAEATGVLDGQVVLADVLSGGLAEDGEARPDVEDGADVQR